MENNAKKPYVCPHCKKEYPVPPKACSCEIVQIIEETTYYFLLKDPSKLEESESILEMDAKEISKEEFMNPTKPGFYVEETMIPGIETVGTFKRVIKKID